MKNASDIETEFKEKAIIRGGILLFDPGVAIDFVRRCREERLNILGIDGFFVTETQTQPCSEHSVDFSIGNKSRSDDGHWQQAEDFVRKRETSNLLFEVVIE